MNITTQSEPPGPEPRTPGRPRPRTRRRGLAAYRLGTLDTVDTAERGQQCCSLM